MTAVRRHRAVRHPAPVIHAPVSTHKRKRQKIKEQLCGFAKLLGYLYFISHEFIAGPGVLNPTVNGLLVPFTAYMFDIAICFSEALT